ncbi:uncharacterized protein LOC125500085 [Athalia rosae]|uniref:uncharacterized protein LOC125500085 n=1 Tax=Athalia rosae TaxID=37344 RepID=UPI002034A22B|nr:uncharacterized protein LOC125500085 [Athalia rosae]
MMHNVERSTCTNFLHQNRQLSSILEENATVDTNIIQDNDSNFPAGTIITHDGTILLPDDNHEIFHKQIPRDENIANNVIEVSAKRIYTNREEYTEIMLKLASLEMEVKTVSRTMSRIEYLLQQTLPGYGQDEQTANERFGTKFPIKNIEDLHDLEQKLNDSALCKDMKRLISRQINPEETLSKNVTAVMKKILSRDVALLFTATRKMEKKIVFKLNVPNICNCIVETLTSRINAVESKVYAALGTVFTNSKDWEGYRINRTRKEKIDEKSDIIIYA